MGFSLLFWGARDILIEGESEETVEKSATLAEVRSPTMRPERG